MTRDDMNKLLPGGRLTEQITLPPAGDIIADAADEADLLAAYYSHPTVVAAFRWSPDPPQPRGHELEAFDEALLETVRKGKPFWRS